MRPISSGITLGASLTGAYFTGIFKPTSGTISPKTPVYLLSKNAFQISESGLTPPGYAPNIFWKSDAFIRPFPLDAFSKLDNDSLYTFSPALSNVSFVPK